MKSSSPPGMVQRRVQDQEMRVPRPPGHRHYAVQQAAPLVAMVGHVLVLERQEAEAGKDGVAVMAVVVHGVAAVDVLPGIAGEVGLLRLDRAAGEAQGETMIQPLHLLQEDHVGFENMKSLAQYSVHHTQREVHQTLYTH